MTPSSLKHRLLAGLLRELQEREGYRMATDKLLQVQELLQRLPDDVPVQRLRSLLAPLFATEPRQQVRFYELFDECLAEARMVFTEETAATPEAETPEQIMAEKGETRWRRILLLFPPLLALVVGFNWDSGVERWYTNPIFFFALAVLLGAGFAAWKLLTDKRQSVAFLLLCLSLGIAGHWLRPAPRLPGSRVIPFPLNVPVGDTLTQRLLQGSDTDTARLLYSEPREVVETDLGGRFRVDSSGIGTYIASPQALVGQTDTLRAFLTFARGTDTVYWMANIISPPEPPPPPDTSLIEELALPFPHDIAELQVDNVADQRFKWYQDYEWPLKGLLLLLLGGLAWAIVRWDRYRRAKVVAELQRPNRPPYVWQPETGQDAAATLAPGLQLLLTRLRGRARDIRRMLDVPATIRATSRRAGRIEFIYRRRTLPPDFLLLIDRLAGNDHRARLYDSLYQVFLQAEAPVARYFYDGDPRLLFDEAHPQGLPLGELLHRHDGAQLIIIGEGQGLLSPITGRTAPWTDLLAAWPRRVLLSPRPLKAWGPRERQLRELMPILPATPGGLNASIDLFNSEDPNDTRSLLPKVKDALHQAFSFQHSLIDDLQDHFDPAVVDWIAACALWPALHWDLTLHLGRTIGERTGRELITFENLRDLTRLPWFAEGRMPDAARRLLLDYLAARGLETPLRESLRELLQQAPAPSADSAAYDDYQMNLILNELFLKPDAGKRRELEREFARYLAAGKQADFVALRLLDRPTNRLDVLLDGTLKKFAFREGLPGLGWKLAPKLLVIWAILALVLLAFRPDFSSCNGEQVTYNKLELCLDGDEDQLLYLEYLARDAILNQDTQKVDSLLLEAEAIRSRDTVFYRNTATRYYNYAVAAYDSSRQLKDSYAQAAIDSLRGLACANFRRGGDLITMLKGTIGIEYFNAIQKACAISIIDPKPQYFSLGGRIVNGRDGTLIGGATVRIGGVDRIATSDTDGRFRFDQLPAITQLEVAVSATGYTPLTFNSQAKEELGDIRLSVVDEGPSPITKLINEMVRVPGGTFTMGCLEKKRDGVCDRGEKPVHEVTVPAFSIGRYEVTQAQWRAVMENDPSRNKGCDDCPVEQVSWDDTQLFIRKLNEQTGQRFRLPSEAEWEYAARGGRDSRGFMYSGSNDVDAAAWYVENSREGNTYGRDKTTRPVGGKLANELRLFDMSGNVLEWCEDTMHDSFDGAPTDGSSWTSGGDSRRVFRGGCWNWSPNNARSAARNGFNPDDRRDNLGFRLALD